MNKENDVLKDNIDERIEAFLRGAMSSEEDTAFKQEIRQNSELRSRAMAMTSLIKGLHDQNSAKETAIIKENTVKSKIRPLLYWACSVAAVLVIAFGIYKEHRYRMLDALVSPYYTEYDMSDASRGDLDTVTISHLYDLFIQIQENRSVSDIIKELEPIYNSFDENFTYNAYANDIAWNLALAYVKDDQIDKTITILQKIKADNPDTPIYNKADELIKKLQEL